MLVVMQRGGLRNKGFGKLQCSRTSPVNEFRDFSLTKQNLDMLCKCCKYTNVVS